ncbi:MAG: O-antigen ligase family protein [Coriobacteriia bacterium]|nr:O-antigen ligase family protein [Coriobacteriia bacterium]MBN2840208.1 O-antigen ligase family protein [Coriobacteriia bacterium]
MDTLTLRDPRVLATLVIASALVGLASAASPLIALAALVVVAALALAWTSPPLYVTALIALSPLFDVGVVSIGPVDVQFMEMGWFLAFAVLVLRTLLARPAGLSKVPLWAIALPSALVLWEAATALTSVIPMRSFIEAAQTGYLAAVMIVTAAVVGALDRHGRMRLALTSAWSFLAIFGVSMFWHYILEAAFPRIIIGSAGVDIAGGLIKVQAAGEAALTLERFGLVNIGPVASAVVFIIALVLAVAALLDTHAERYQLLSLAVAACAGLGLVLTYSRAGWVVGAAMIWLLGVKLGPRRMLILTLALAALAGVAAMQPAVAARLQEFTDMSEGSFAVHVRMWVTAIWMTVSRPLTGWGPGSFKEIAPSLGIGTEYWPWMANQDTHNWVLQASSESGIIGAGILVALVLALLGTTVRTAFRRHGLLAYGPWVAAISVILMNLTLNTFRTEVTWVIFGVLLATILWKDADESVPSRGGDR